MIIALGNPALEQDGRQACIVRYGCEITYAKINGTDTFGSVTPEWRFCPAVIAHNLHNEDIITGLHHDLAKDPVYRKSISKGQPVLRPGKGKKASTVFTENPACLPHDLKHYLSRDDYNDTFYHSNTREEQILKDAVAAAEYLTAIDDSGKELEQLQRVLKEQTVIDEASISLCDASMMNSRILQSPHDPDATFRRKLHSNHVGYVANLLESPGKDGSIILDYQYQKNIYSDNRFLKDMVHRLGYQQRPAVLVTDGGYSGKYNRELAVEKNIQLITTNLTGRPNAEYLVYRSTEEFKKYARFRNGVEAPPSLLRRKYRVDTMPVRGLSPTAFFFGCKIGAINIRKFCKWMQDSRLSATKQA